MQVTDAMVWGGLALWAVAQLLGMVLRSRRDRRRLRAEYLRGYRDGLTKRRNPRRRP